MKQIALIPVLFFIMAACGQYPDLKKELNEAQENRRELEKVIVHYSSGKQNPLKLQAARYLIANMPGHYGCDREQLDSVSQLMLPIILSGHPLEEKQRLLEQLSTEYDFSHGPARLAEDIRVITADYLIRQIDRAFSVWENEPWCRHLNFDEFCEYILPYRCIENQPLDYWQDTLKPMYSDPLEVLQYCHYFKESALEACRQVCFFIRSSLHVVLVHDYKGYPFIGSTTLGRPPFGLCEDYADVTMAVMRSKGIPVAVDMTPQWAEQKGGHSWNVLLMNEGQELVFGGIADQEPGVMHKPYEKKIKVFRKTYARNEALVELNKSERTVPPFFQNIFLRDVTRQYMKTTDIDIPMLQYADRENKYGYLAAFDNRDWVPLDFGERKKEKIHYQSIGRHAVLLPVLSEDGILKPVNYPFIITRDDEVRHLIPDTNRLETIHLTRKYPVRPYVYHAADRIVGAELQVSNDPGFSDAKTIYRFDRWRSEVGVRVDSIPPHRYWRFLSAPMGNVFVGELMFFPAGDTTRAVRGRIIGSEGSANNNGRVKELAFDGDLETNFDAANPSGDWVGMDFGTPTPLSKIVCYPATDANNIQIGDRYELFYHDLGGWVSLGKKEAVDVVLSYGNAPHGALLLLKNLSRGVETRIFTYEDNQQVWW